MTFLFQSLLAVGLPLVALPLLIHLINLRRRRRIEWAAMDFLLASQKRNKKWILLRQLLLLLLRTAAIAAAVLMLAGPVLRSSWGQLLGRGTTHHLILLDDSYSMADRWQRTSAWDEAKRVVAQIVEQAADGTTPGQLTLLRFSQAANLSAGAAPDIDRRTLDRQLTEELQTTLGQLSVSESDAGPIEALQAVARLPEPSDDETRIVYLLTDFRERQWTEDAQLRQLLNQLQEQVAQLRLVQCVRRMRPNLAVTVLEAESGIRAAGVETWMRLAVANYGDEAATAVAVGLEQDGIKLPAVEIDEIPPGEEVSRRFRVTFVESGAHRLKATLPSDAVETDNARYFACHLPVSFSVLLVDGSAEGDDGYYLQTALSPGGRQSGGWSPEVRPPSFLRKHDELARFAAICLLDVARLNDPEILALEEYVRQGGGVAIFVGPQIGRRFYNEHLYRDDTGLMPVALDLPTQLLADGDQTTADIEVTPHPIFRVFDGKRNSFLSVATVNFYYAVEPGWRLPISGNTRVLARLHNGAPLVVDKQLGEGHVVVQLTKLSPKQTELGSWNNWSLNPVFPIFANELVGYLSSSRRQDSVRTLREGLGLSVAEADYGPEIRLRRPGQTEVAATTLIPRATDGQLVIDSQAALAEGMAATSGIWQFDLSRRDGNREKRLIALNVPNGEGDLHRLDRQAVAKQLKGVDYLFSMATEMTTATNQLAGYRLSDSLLYLLVALLVGEQLLAYSASYHNRSSRGSP